MQSPTFHAHFSGPIPSPFVKRWEMKRIEVLGHDIVEGVMTPQIDKLGYMKRDCRTRRDVQSLLGSLGYFRKFVPRFADVMKPVVKLLWDSGKIEWGEEQREAVAKVVGVLQSECFLALPDFS